MTKRKKFLYSIFAMILALVLYLGYYKPVDSFPDALITPQTTKFVGHRGGGSTGFSDGDELENTVEAVKYGLTHLPAVEVDIQMGKDKTIYVYHHENIHLCPESEEVELVKSTDEQISAHMTCDIVKLYRLEEVLHIIKDKPNSKISLDVKGYYFVESIWPNQYMIDIAEQIANLAESMNVADQVMVESDRGVFIEKIEALCPEIETYYTVFDWPYRGASEALDCGADGISLKYEAGKVDKEYMALIRKKGLRIQFWTLNDPEVIKTAIELKADYIQTDKIKQAQEFETTD